MEDKKSIDPLNNETKNVIKLFSSAGLKLSYILTI